MKLEIIATLTEMLMLENIGDQRTEARALISSYKEILKKEEADSLVEFIHENNNEEEFIFLKEENDLLFEELEISFDNKIEREDEEKERVMYSENLRLCEELIEELRTVIQSEENIGKAFNRFKEVQEKWLSVGPVHQKQYTRVQSEYSKLRENFFYNINIYKELADNDKKKNLSQKKRIIEKVKLLSSEKSIKKLNEGIKPLLKEWDEVGPTFSKDWEEIREEFWNETRAIFERINTYYDNIRVTQEKNSLSKKVLIEKLKGLTTEDPDKHKVWQKVTDQIKQLQAEWKGTGFASKKENDTLWSEFRGLCDSFFNKKKVFYSGLRKDQDSNEIAKEAIINQAEFLKDSQDWKQTGSEFIKLQAEWKNIGPASQKSENGLWKRFRTHCDTFFTNKKEFFAGREDREKENLKLKDELINRIIAFTPTGNSQADMIALKEFSRDYKEIGFVPFAKKNEIHNAYSKALDEKYNSLKMEKAEKVKHLYINKLEVLSEAPNARDLLRKERHIIKDKMSRLSSDIIQFENNMGFFGRGEGAEKMKREVQAKIDMNKKKVNELKQQLQLIDSVKA